MSTRRARIKAVAALPQRRKNVDKADSKLKQDQVKELVEDVLKSPKARRTSIEKRKESSPARAALPSPRQSPRSPRVSRNTPDLEKASTKLRTPTPNRSEKRSTTPHRDKTDTNKTTTWRVDVFISPQPRASPLRKRSPVVKTPVKEINVRTERQYTPNKKTLKPQDAPKNTKVSEKVKNTESLERKSDAVSSKSKTDRINIPSDYNSPNTPDTADVMDGIVPLEPVSNAPKPIDLLKSEIISENFEVLFDPIVPLPSPTKARQKLRPVPRLGPMRRNSVPGSASESEDESRRALCGGASTPVPSRQRHNSHTSHNTNQSLTNREVSRVRYDSVSQTTQIVQSPVSPIKEKNASATRRQEVSRRMAAIRRRRESVQRDKLTMFDLIFYNPMANPIVPDQDEIKAKEATKKEEEQRSKVESKEEATEETNDASQDSAASAPVPQIKLGPNGEIMLDEQSLVIKQSEQRKLSDSVIHEGAWMPTNGRVYRRTTRTADWTDAETVRFYRALAGLGTDFSLMVELFPGRTRRDLKLKFKKEERINLPQVDKALRSGTSWDASRLLKEFAEERKLAEEKDHYLKEQLMQVKKAEKEQTQALKKLKLRRSQGAKALGLSALPMMDLKSKRDKNVKDQSETKKTRKQGPRKLKKDVFIPSSPKRTEEVATLTPSRRKTPQPKVGIPRLHPSTIERSKPLVSPTTRPSPLISPTTRPSPFVSPPMRPTPLDSSSMRPTPLVYPPMRPTPLASPTMRPTPLVYPPMRPKPLVSPTMRPTPSVSPTMRPTPFISPAMRPTPLDSPTMRPTPLVSSTMRPTPLVSPTMRPTPVISPTRRPTPFVSPTMRPTRIISPSIRPTPLVSPKMRPTPLVSPTMRPTPLVSPTMRPTPVISPTMRPTSVISPTVRPPPVVSPTRRPPPHKSPVVLNALPAVPADIAPGSLVVLTVDDPKAPSQKAIHTYIKQPDGSITSIILDPSVMSSLVSYVKKDTSKAGSSSSMMSPSSVNSDRTSTPPTAASPKRKRLSSYTITQL